ncbi:hypothetical protein JDW21_18690 [Bacillus subtilis]|uniref:Uncharacterized protein n=2 Tax=Zhangjivirus TaxID=3044867 RepID=A0AAE9G9T8_9CAUD|nr:MULTISPECIES: hypothetical protein [Bacillus subtilis group]YP_010681638.1 hypothetical protein PQE76_gp020 [Bacillus phage vB_BsuS_PJN02]YP_010740148.1 hypothetical protein P9294_gp131 [Bacillus phage FADO]MCR4362165.1 hypothetical protein [Bacillus subtilis]UNH58363.1 hypothetical protein [Bacillus phage vB_BsuS_PJN02]UNY48846.1 hypothetical protein fado_131 [Bacillus phage FADO]UQB84235.1 hypothetical protein KMZ31_20190 [Bacillus amyloliquefaciens]WOF32858.1 hypothetical protein OEJ84
MEFWLLTKVGIVVKTAVWAGYGLAGSYVVRTCIRYVQDYKESVARENGMK